MVYNSSPQGNISAPGIDNQTMMDSPNATQDKNATDYENLHNFPLFTAALMMVRVVFPTIVAVGTVANTLVVIILRRGAIRIDNLSFYLSCLAVVDTLFLYTSAFKTWVRVMWGFELLHLGTWSCKLGLFSNHLFLTLSAWLVVVIAWQRWYTCSRPFDRCCPVESSKCGFAALVSLLVILIGVNSYVLLTVELHKGEWGYVCAPIKEYEKLIGNSFPYILMVLYSGLPAILLLILNGLLASVLYTSRRSLLSHEDSARSNGRDDSHVRARYNYVTALLMCLAMSWFLLTLPHSILKLIEDLFEMDQRTPLMTFLNVLFFVLMYVNHSINFFLYCALTRSFRREGRRIMSRSSRWLVSLPSRCYRRCCPPAKRQPVPGSSTSSSHNPNGHSINNGSGVPLLEYKRELHQREMLKHGRLVNDRI